MAPSHGLRVGAGHWQESSVLHHTDLSVGFLGVLLTLWVSCREPLTRERGSVFYDITLEVTRHHCHNIWLITKVSPVQCGNGPDQIMKTMRRGLLRLILEAGWDSHLVALNDSPPSHMQNPVILSQCSPTSHTIAASFQNLGSHCWIMSRYAWGSSDSIHPNVKT